MIFIDSNIVITFFADSHPHHDRSHAFVIEELKKGTILAISPQVIGETFRALTSPHAVEHPISPDEFLDLADHMLGVPNVQMVSPGKMAVTTAVQAAAKLRLTSHRIFDLLLYGHHARTRH